MCVVDHELYIENFTRAVAFSGAPVAFKTWWGHQHMVGIICPAGWSRVKVAAKIFWGLVSMPTGTPEYCFSN